MVALAVCACGKKSNAVAQLVKANGTVDRWDGKEPSDAGDPWRLAFLGTQYFIGDAARTREDASATLAIAGGVAQIVMQAGTVLRFGGQPGRSTIGVTEGAIQLANNASYSLDIGDVQVSPNSTVEITAKGEGRSSVVLVVGTARGAANGAVFDLEIGKPADIGKDARVPADAGVDAPAPVDAAIDAAAVAVVEGAGIEVTGRRAELLAPGETAWKPLPAGPGTLAKGSAIRLGTGTTAKVVANGTTLELAGGARMKLGDDLAFALELGSASATATGAASVALPGGAIALAGAPTATAEARLDSNNRDTRVAIARGAGKLTGASGAELDMNRGETASLGRNGAIRVIEAIPSYFDFRVSAGESLTIHDPKPPTAVQFQFDGKCPGGGIIEIDRNERFRTPKQSGGREFANVMIGGGAWSYRLRCTSNGAEGSPVASGRVASLRDDGRRPLPRAQSTNEIEPDGRSWRISYQSAIPNLVVKVKNPGSANRLHLASAGKEQTFDSSTPSIAVPGHQLREGTYTYWLDRDGVKQDKVSTLTIDFDQTAPQVYIESPANGEAWKGDIDVRGAVLPGWSADVGASAIPIDKQRRFAAKVGIPGGNALAIRLSHPQRGVHYYLRRGSKAAD